MRIKSVLPGAMRIALFILTAWIGAIVPARALQPSPSPAGSPPVVARLDLLSTPTLGAAGQAIWVGIPNITPEAAELVFTLRFNQAIIQRIKQKTNLKAGQISEKNFAFATPTPGIYQIDALAIFHYEGKTHAFRESLALCLDEDGHAVQKSAKPRVNSPVESDALLSQNKPPSTLGLPSQDVDFPPKVLGFHLDHTRSYCNQNGLVTQREVFGHNDVTGNPVAFMLSESPLFNGTKWQPYSPAPSYSLSPGNGTKVVYFKACEADGTESNVTSASIMLVEAIPLKPGAPKVVHSVSNPGESDWYGVNWNGYPPLKLEVTPQGVRDVVVTLYEKQNPPRRLAQVESAKGQKAVIFPDFHGNFLIEVRARSSKATGSYAIQLRAGELLGIKDFSGDALVMKNEIKWRLSVYGKPTEYKISESPVFKDAGWKAYKRDIKFKLSSGKGLKRIYIKLRDREGFESTSSIWVRVTGIRPLAIDGSFVDDYLDYYYEHDYYFYERAFPDYEPKFSFDVTSTGSYRLDLQQWAKGDPFTLPDCAVYLDGPDRLGRNLTAFNAKLNYSGVLKDLKPGRYYIRIFPLQHEDEDEYTYFSHGSFSIRISRYKSEPLFSDFSLNQGSDQTPTPQVTLNHTISAGTPAFYMASESPSFVGAAWHPYQIPLTYQLSSQNGYKTVYLKFKNASGVVGNTLSDSIDFFSPPPLILDAPEQNCHTHRDPSWRVLEVAEGSRVRIEAQPTTGVSFSLIASNGYTIIAYNDFEGTLDPGFYYVKIHREIIDYEDDGWDGSIPVYYEGPYTLRAWRP